MTTSLRYLLALLTTYGMLAQAPDLSRWQVAPVPTDETSMRFQRADAYILTEANDIVLEAPASETPPFHHLPFSAEFIREKLPQLAGYSDAMEVSGGYLVGINHGEFGGRLLFVSTDGAEVYDVAGTSSRFAMSLNIRRFFRLGGRLFAIEGLSHLGLDRGQILEITKGDKWIFKTLISLDSAPVYVSVYGKNRLILTNTAVYLLDLGGTVEKILTAPFYWGLLYPTSLKVVDNALYIPMRGGIVQIRDFETKPIFVWYVPMQR